jgi:hypothetical protein
MTDAFSANMGRNAPFWKALKEWNAKNKLKSWCVPARGTPEYFQVMKIMREKYARSSARIPAQAAAPPAQAAAPPARGTEGQRRGTEGRRRGTEGQRRGTEGQRRSARIAARSK